jgi:hypothetical protein
MMMGADAAANDDPPRKLANAHSWYQGLPSNAQEIKEADARRRRPLMARTK